MHYKDKVEFIQGTPVKDSDLDRVSAKVASAFYLLADQQAKVSPQTKLSNQGISYHAQFRVDGFKGLRYVGPITYTSNSTDKFDCWLKAGTVSSG